MYVAPIFFRMTEEAPIRQNHQVLITGGTGFLGRALARRLVENPDVARLCIFSRGEFQQAMMRREFHGLDPTCKMRWFIGDIRDRERLARAMEGIDLVIHAAALKRVEVGEYNPTEMVKTNVLGAMNLVEAAHEARVKKLIAISSDKACMPVNTYGASKMMMEKIVLGAQATRSSRGPIYAVARYGNVAGSTGSVIPIWRSMIQKFNEGAPNVVPLHAGGGRAPRVPLTARGCTRFWMFVDQAVDLVLWTADNMEGGELVVPVLDSYVLEDLAVALGAEPYITEMGPGEKYNELMVHPMEAHQFKYIAPYLVAGGVAHTHGVPLQGEGSLLPSRRLTVEQLRERLKEVP